MAYVFFGVLGIALLMVIHESGHYLSARAFGMKVIRFSIGFGPAIWRHRSRKNDTIFQVALIPFFAFVQIAGMNPFEDVDPEDEGSYANASLFGRIATIVAGPLANYLFASVLFFGAFYIGGESIWTKHIKVMDDGAAKHSHMMSGDEIVKIGKDDIKDFEQLRDIVMAHANQPLQFTVRRDGKELQLTVTPESKAEGGKGQIGVTPVLKEIPMTLGAAAKRSVTEPAMIVKSTVVQIVQIITREVDPQIAGPVKIGEHLGKAAERGIHVYLWWLGLLSAYLGAFNMLPYPALDGGRFVFLSYEAVTRRKPNARLEASIHTVGLLTLLALITVVTVKEVGNLVTGEPDKQVASEHEKPKPKDKDKDEAKKLDQSD